MSRKFGDFSFTQYQRDHTTYLNKIYRNTIIGNLTKIIKSLLMTDIKVITSAARILNVQ